MDADSFTTRDFAPHGWVFVTRLWFGPVTAEALLARLRQAPIDTGNWPTELVASVLEEAKPPQGAGAVFLLCALARWLELAGMVKIDMGWFSPYDTMFCKQGGTCAICHRYQKEQTKRMAVDHDHKTGVVRGLLCERCNRGLGFFGDKPAVLSAALHYLKNSNKT